MSQAASDQSDSQDSDDDTCDFEPLPADSTAAEYDRRRYARIAANNLLLDSLGVKGAAQRTLASVPVLATPLALPLTANGTADTDRATVADRLTERRVFRGQGGLPSRHSDRISTLSPPDYSELPAISAVQRRRGKLVSRSARPATVLPLRRIIAICSGLATPELPEKDVSTFCNLLSCTVADFQLLPRGQVLAILVLGDGFVFRPAEDGAVPCATGPVCYIVNDGIQLLVR
jgi:hypothetical protein